MKTRCSVWSAIILITALGWAVPSLDQTAQGQHAEHHPGSDDSAGSANASGMASDEGTGRGMGGMRGGMGEMGGMGGMGMGASPRKELYPSLMNLPDLPPEKRADVERQAHDRMTNGADLMSTGLSTLSTSAGRDDYAMMQRATEQMREGLAQFESGLAAHRALAEARPPRDVALQWFKGELNLLPATSSPPPHGIFGLSWFHYFVMALLLASTISMVWMYYHRVRRADALLAALGGTRHISSAPVMPSATLLAPSAAPAMVARIPGAADAATPLVTIPAGRWSGQLRVAKVFQETPDVRTFRLVHPSGGDFPLLPFVFEPGQFLTVTANINGKETKRAYSIASSSCQRTFCELTVKRTPSGLVSNYLHEQIQVGDLVGVSGPFGKFTFRGHEASSVVLIAGGVGVTPLMSAIRCLADQAWTGEIFLIYACSTMQDIIFHEELEYLVRRHANFQMTITLSREPSSTWTGPRGHVTRDLLTKAVPSLSTRRVHVCGPPPMMEAVKSILAEMGVPLEQVKSENFLGAEPRPAPPPGVPTAVEPVKAAVSATCRFVRSGKNAPFPPDKTVLEASEDVGVNIDYSCREGYCGVCKVTLLSGQVTMASEESLTQQDKAANIILACQAKSIANVEVDA